MFFSWLVAFSGSVMVGQSPFDPSLYSAASGIQEHLEVFTDRNLYVVEESIRFRADYFLKGLPGEQPWSSVLYAELVGPEGQRITSGKFGHSRGIFAGTLQIPSGTLTGNYFLKCYTRWMRNSGPDSYSYTPVKIVNPYRAEIAGQSDARGGSANGESQRRRYLFGTLESGLNEEAYDRGDEIHLRLTAPIAISPKAIRCCVTVVPAGAVDTVAGQFIFPQGSLDSAKFAVQYLPDMGNMASLSGKVVSGDGTPVGKGGLYFALLGHRPDLITAECDEYGRFVAQIPADELEQELFVTPVPGDSGPLQILIDNDFDGARLPVSPGRFHLSAPEIGLATKMSIRAQLASSYVKPDTTRGDTEDHLDTLKGPFYGSRVQLIDLDDYVTLPLMEEVFINLVTNVNVVRTRGESRLVIQSENSAMGYYDPLILIDYIPVFDHRAVMTLDTRDFVRIEVIGDIYLKGNIVFGGIISLHTREGNMAGIDLPDGSYFFDFISLQRPVPEAKSGSVEGDRIPDLRNTVLWMEDMLFDPGSTREVTFRAPDAPGEYVVLVRSAISSGVIFSAQSRFSVQ
jgi:hypothetical protein